MVVANAGPQTGDVVGYYKLATGGVTSAEMRRKIRQDLPNPVPVLMLAGLAVDQRHQKKGMGPAILIEAMQRTLAISQSARVRALMVHAIDDVTIPF